VILFIIIHIPNNKLS